MFPYRVIDSGTNNTFYFHSRITFSLSIGRVSRIFFKESSLGKQNVRMNVIIRSRKLRQEQQITYKSEEILHKSPPDGEGTRRHLIQDRTNFKRLEDP